MTKKDIALETKINVLCTQQVIKYIIFKAELVLECLKRTDCNVVEATAN